MASICLMVTNKEESALLRGFLSDKYTIVTAKETFFDAPCDLFITDAIMLDKNYSKLLQTKKSCAPVLLPILLITTKREIDLFHDVWQTIDEVITAPIEITELLGRIGVLLRMREQSLQLQNSLKDLKIANSKLRASENESKTLTENIPEVIARFDREMRHLFINKYGTKVYGIDHEKIIGKSSAELGLPEQLVKSFVAPFQIVWQTGKQQTIDFDYESPTYGHRCFSSVFVPEFNDASEVVSILTITHDVTDVKKVQYALAFEKERLQAILDNLIVGMIFLDENGTFIKFNNAALKFHGFTTEAEMWERLPEYINTFDFQDIHGESIPFENWPATRAIKGEYVKNFIAKLTRRSTGISYWLSYTAIPIRDSHGQVKNILMNLVDITDMKMVEQALRESEEKFRSIFEQAAVGIGLVGFHDARWIDVNPAFSKILGYSADEFKATPWPQITYPDDIDLDLKPFKQMASDELDTYTVEKRFIHKKGHLVWTRLTLSLVRNSNKQPGYEIAIIEDISGRRQAEEALRESEEHFRTLADNMSQLAWMADPKGRIFWYNKRWFDYTGTTFEEMQGSGSTKMLHQEHVDRVVKKLLDAFDTGEIWEDTFPLRGKDGNYRWFLSRAIPIRNDKGGIVRWFGTNTDITDLINLQRQFDTEKRLLQTIIDSIPVMITLYDQQINKIEPNKQLELITGWSQEDIQNKNFLELVIPDPKYREEAAEYMRSLTPGFRDIILRTKSGEDIETSWANVKLPDGRQVGIGIDIRDRLRREREIQVSAERFKAITSSNIIGFIITNFNGKISFANDYYLNIVGYTREELEKGVVDWKALTSQEHLKSDYRALEQLRAYGRAEPYEKQYKRRDGKEPWVLLYDAMLPGKEDQIFAFVLDISTKKRLEGQLKSRLEELATINKELESFSYSVAHDLRNPLKTIQGFIELLMEDCNENINDECKNYINRINTGADRMNSIIDDILALSKISRQEISINNVDLSEMAKLTIEELKRSQPDHNVEVFIQNNLSVHADARLMSVTLGNLLGNAWKYSSKSEKPRIEFGAFEKDGDTIYYVKDNGAGFDMSHADKLFVPFKRLHSDKEFSGTGVGLAIVDRAISRHGGRVWAEGELGKGATFYFTL